MQTLLTKVKAVEEEAQQLVKKTQQKDAAQLQALRAREEKMIGEVRQQAQQKADAIVAEKLQQAEQEAASIKQHSENAVAAVHEVAKKNRVDTLKLVTRLFTEEYGL